MAKIGVAIDMVGWQFFEWTVLRRATREEVGDRDFGPVYWLCRCSCGFEQAITGNTLRRKRSQRCGTCRNKLRSSSLKGKPRAKYVPPPTIENGALDALSRLISRAPWGRATALGVTIREEADAIS